MAECLEAQQAHSELDSSEEACRVFVLNITEIRDDWHQIKLEFTVR